MARTLVRNSCDIQGRTATTIVAAACFVLWLAPFPVSSAEGVIPNFDRVHVLQPPRLIEDAELTNQFGKLFKLSQLHGRVAFVFFGFTNCPDICPTAMSNFRRLQQSGLIDNEKIAYVLISVDGERDTPEVVRKYLDTYSSDFIGLTAEPRLVKPIAKQFSVAFYKGNESPDKYQVAHSPQAFVLDPAGRLRAELYSASPESMAGVADALLEESQSTQD